MVFENGQPSSVIPIFPGI